MFILCVNNFWAGFIPSIVAAGVVLILTFILLGPKLSIKNKAVIIKEGGFLRFQVHNWGLINMYDVKAYLYNQKVDGKNAVRGDIDLLVSHEPIIKGCLNKEYEHTVLLETNKPFDLAQLEDKDLYVQVSAINAISNISRVKEHIFTKNDILYGNIENGKLVDYNGNPIVLFEDTVRCIKNWLIWGSIGVVSLTSLCYILNCITDFLPASIFYIPLCVALFIESILLVIIGLICLKRYRIKNDTETIIKNKELKKFIIS